MSEGTIAILVLLVLTVLACSAVWGFVVWDNRKMDRDFGERSVRRSEQGRACDLLDTIHIFPTSEQKAIWERAGLGELIKQHASQAMKNDAVEKALWSHVTNENQRAK